MRLDIMAVSWTQRIGAKAEGTKYRRRWRREKTIAEASNNLCNTRPRCASHLASKSGESVASQVHECAQSISADLDSDLDRVSLVLCFVSDKHELSYSTIVPHIREYFPNAIVAGASAGGVIGGWCESENEQTISILAATLPFESVKPFKLDAPHLPDLDARPDEWREALGNASASARTVIALPDPAFQRTMSDALNGMKYAFPSATIVGGLVGGGFERRALFYHDTQQGGYFRNTPALVGIVLEDCDADVLVCQGAAPIVGKKEGDTADEFEVLSHEKSLITQVQNTRTQEQMTPLEALKAELERVDEDRRQHVAKSLLVAVTPSPAASDSLTAADIAAAAGFSQPEQFAASEDPTATSQDESEGSGSLQRGDPPSNRDAWLVRPIAGAEPKSGALALGDSVFQGQKLMFMARDAESAREDVRAQFSNLKRIDLEQRLHHGSVDDSFIGGFQVTCNGRGAQLFEEPGFDCRAFAEARPVPSAGFFAGGEIAPLNKGSQPYVHGFTSVFVTLRYPASSTSSESTSDV